VEHTLEAPKATLAEELSKRIRRFKKQRPHLSSQQISKRFGVTSSTLNRIENLDIRTPSFDQVLKILKGTGNEEDIVKYVEANYPDAGKAFVNHIKSDAYWKALSPEFVEALKDPETSKILFIVESRNETSLDYIQKHYGLEGIKILKRLQLQKFIELKNGKVYSKKNLAKIPNKKDSRDILTTIIKNHYDFIGSMEGTAENHLEFGVSSVSANKAMPVIKDILSEASSKILEVINQKEYEGNDSFYWGLTTDTLVPNKVRFERSQLKEKI
jgi:transcriptional regulator with XRE-family HTH domain